MKIVKLTIDEENEFEGIDAVALVEEPAIELDFQAFTKYQFQSFDDYPKAAKQAAIVGIQRNKDLGNKCGTQVGKVRAQQLAQGKPVTLDTIKRMRAFLIRQKNNYDLAVKRKDYDACGYISYLLWGGPAALPWAEKKLRQAGLLEENNTEIIRDEFAEIGPRGGIKPSRKAPKSDTPGEGKRGSERNKPGAAGGERGNIKISEAQEKSLQKKSDDFNEKYKDKLGYGVSLPKLKAVYQRGIGAFQTSHSPNVKSAEQWAQARVNAFLYLVKNGRPQNKKYTADFDLLPAKHPKSTKTANSFANIKDIDGIPVFQDPGMATKLAEEIGCEGIHQHEIEGALYYMPCARHSEATDLMLKNKEEMKYFDDMDSDTQELLLKALDNVGISEDKMYEDGWEEITEDNFYRQMYFAIGNLEKYADPEKRSYLDTPNYRILYQYSGPQDSRNRAFCSKLIGLTKTKKLLYRIEDINNMSLQGANNEFSTYDIFRYKGSYNCRHSWIQKFYRESKPVDEQKRSIQTNIGPVAVVGGPRTQEASQTNPKSRTQAEVEAGVPAGEFQFSQLQEQQLLVTPIMVADKLIPRIDENGEKYYVFFDADGIKKLSYKLMKNKLIDSINIEHDADKKVNDINLVETWLVEDEVNDKSRHYGYNVPKGSWMGIYKVDNKDVWDNYIKTGKVKGVSVEGLFADKIIMQNKINNATS